MGSSSPIEVPRSSPIEPSDPVGSSSPIEVPRSSPIEPSDPDPRPTVVEHVEAEPAQLLGPWPEGAQVSVRRVRVATVRSVAALVLGSTQGRAPGVLAQALAPGEAPEPRGALGSAELPELLRRRGGGGAVLVAPDAQLWIDLWLPRSDARWEDDVVAGVRWIGEAWAGALSGAGLHGLHVHQGSSQGGAVARSVCFAGLGPGEVVIGDPPRKVMGLSQHRSKDGARIQMLAVRSWDPDPIVHRLCRAGLLDPAEAGRFLETARVRAVGLADLGLWPSRRDQPDCIEDIVDRLASG